MQVIQPFHDCQECQKQFQELKSLYGMYKACPADPGATALLQASLEAYNQHHQEANHYPSTPLEKE